MMDLKNTEDYKKANVLVNHLKNKNLKYFKKHLPSLYSRLISYSSTRFFIEYDPKGFINIKDSDTSSYVYSDDPLEYARNQVEEFHKLPLKSSLGFKKTPPTQTQFKKERISPEAGNRQIELINSLDDNIVGREFYETMIVLGVGLGYQLEYLISSCRIDNMVIVEPELDVFYCSIHTIDWGSVLSCFNRGIVRLEVGGATHDLITTINFQTLRFGLHNVIDTYLYLHFKSDKLLDFVEVYKNKFTVAATTTGFYDDERISFAHTVRNIQDKRCLVNLYRDEDLKLPPVLILGNGPSLDADIEAIKINRHKFFIVSAGSTLKTLERYNIKPDFHIEIERPKITPDWIKRYVSEEFRKGINLITLNTAHPELFDLFESSYMFAKGSDAGCELLYEIERRPIKYALPFCNPTVANGALSFSLMMGFEEIYLSGIDLGASNTSDHHSKNSVYSDFEKLQGFRSPFEGEDIVVPGNKSEYVYSSYVFNISRLALERLILEFDSVNFYNTSYGAKIEGAKPVEPAVYEALPDVDYRDFRNIVLEKLEAGIYSSGYEDCISWVNSTFSPLVESIAVSIKLDPTNWDSYSKVKEDLDDVVKTLDEISKRNKALYRIIAGSINQQLGYISIIGKRIFWGNNDSEVLKESVRIYNEFIDCMLLDMKISLLELDSTYLPSE